MQTVKQHIGTKLCIGLLVAIVIFGATRAAMRSKAAEAERQKAQAAAAAAGGSARQTESEPQ